MALGTMYSMQFSNVAVAAVQDLFSIKAVTNSVVVIHECHCGQETEEGDTQAEMLSWSIVYGSASTVGSGGSAVTPNPLQIHSTASVAGAAGRANDTTEISGGTLTTIHSDAFHVAAGLHYVPTPDARPVVSGVDFLAITLLETPADTMDMYGVLIFEELGG